MAPKRPPDKQGEKRKLNEAFIRNQFKPGQSGNLKGRPRLETPSETMRRMLTVMYGGFEEKQIKLLQESMPEPWRSKRTKDLTMQEILVWIGIRAAMPSKARQDRSDLWDRVEGKPVMKIAGADGGPIEIVTGSLDPKRMTDDELRRYVDGDMTMTEVRQIMIRISSGESGYKKD